jgi:hypothetical protein
MQRTPAATDPDSIAAPDQAKLIAVYERLCPDDVIAVDDPRRGMIAAEVYDVGTAATLKEALQVIQWWGQDSVQTKEFVIATRRAVSRMKFQPMIAKNRLYFFTKSGNQVRTIAPAEPIDGQPCWTVERTTGSSKGKQMIVPARALVAQLD